MGRNPKRADRPATPSPAADRNMPAAGAPAADGASSSVVDPGPVKPVVNAPVGSLATPARAVRPRLRRWVDARDRWMDAGTRWAFAGQERHEGPVTPRPRRVTTGAHRGIIPVEVLPLQVQIVVAWASTVLVVAWAAKVVMDVVGAVAVVVIPLSVAVLLAAFLNPFRRWLTHGLHLHRGLAAGISVLGFAAVLIAGSTFAGTQLAAGMSDMTASVGAGATAILEWLRTGPLHLSNAQLEDYVAQAQEGLRSHSGTISDGAIAAGLSTIDFLAGTIVCLIATFFFLYDGERIWTFITRLLPPGARRPTFEAGRRGWVSLSAYARTQIIVAGADALGIAGGAFILGLPLVIPLFFIVLVASVVPIVGAIVAGAVPVLMALVLKGPVTALIMLAIVVAVQQIEAHILQPFLMGRAVDLHPLAVIVAVTAAAYLFGVAGALFAVPLLAFVNMAVRYLLGDDPFPEIGDVPFVATEEAAAASPHEGPEPH